MADQTNENPADDDEANTPDTADDAALAEAKAAAQDAEKSLEAVQAEAAAELPADDRGASGAETQKTGARPNRRKVREGIVVSDAMNATVVVAVVERVRHPRYGKTVQRTKKLYVHDAENTAKVGDRVRVQETRPISKLKHWRVTQVMERAR
jgi:small subunit ribosomal protein S17